MKISKRLINIASLVDDNSNIIDVGCDHALLDIYLVLNKKNIKIIASDINKGPLEKAKENIFNYQVEDKIKLNLSDGIKDIDNSIDTIIISGMGGESIIDILKKDKSKLDNIDTLILSPHSDIYEVRKYLTSINYKIKDEIIIYDSNKYYIVIKFIKGIELYSEDELRYGPILLKNKDELFYKYYSSLKEKKEEVIKKIPKDNQDYFVLNKEIKKLDELLNI